MEITEIHEAPIKQEVCANIITALPEWFGIPESNKNYISGVADRRCFAAAIAGKHVGLIAIEELYQYNINIYWLGVLPKYHRQGIGTKLVQKIYTYCYCKNINSITVETLSAKLQDPNYLQTYNFYLKHGFIPLFDKFIDPNNTLVYMQKPLGLPPIQYIDLTHTLTANIPTWNGSCGFTNEIKLDYSDCKSDIKFRVQQLKMHAGIGTHMDAPAHCVPNGITIDNIDVSKFILPCVKIDLSDKKSAHIILTKEDIIAFEDNYGQIPKNSFVIVYTGWEQYWLQSKKYLNAYNFPSVSKQAAEFLLIRNIAGIGIDTLSPDRPIDGFNVHKLFLENNKLIIENIANATALPNCGSYIIALPLKVQGGTEAPVRLIAMTFK